MRPMPAPAEMDAPNRQRRALLAASLGGLLQGAPGSLARAEAGPRRTLVLANAIYPPFVNPPGHELGEGMDIDIARIALARGSADPESLAIELRLLPWKRVLLQLENGEADFTTTIARTGDRDRFLAWSAGYRQFTSYRFYARRGSPSRVQSLADLTGRTLGLSAGFNYPPTILEVAGLRVETGKDIASTVRMLQAGRVDFIVVNATAGAFEIRELGLQDTLAVQPFVYDSDSPTYMAFSRARAFAEALAAMNAGLAAMLRDGSLVRIERHYLG